MNTKSFCLGALFFHLLAATVLPGVFDPGSPTTHTPLRRLSRSGLQGLP
ncbi:MAG: hypothetical protein WDN28_12205 [Chthoniobacter sp.]